MLLIKMKTLVQVCRFNDHYIHVKQLQIIPFYRKDTSTVKLEIKWKNMQNESKFQPSHYQKNENGIE